MVSLIIQLLKLNHRHSVNSNESEFYRKAK
jgi:hypothetical protein